MGDDFQKNPVILFDGVCLLCERSVQFVIRHDPRALFCFAPLQSSEGQGVIEAVQDQLSSINLEQMESFLLVEQGRVYFKSEAWFRIVASLEGKWRWLRFFGVLPRFLTDFIYDLVGRHRYRIFGRRDSCLVPDDSIRQRFLGSS